jgi:transketolase
MTMLASPEVLDMSEVCLSAVELSRLAQLDVADDDPRVFSLEGDLGDFGGLAFAAAHPDQYLDLGIAEANLIGVAAGLAARGRIVFVNTFASFALMRACEQVRLDVAYHRSNVKIVGTFAGIAAGFSGPTHHCAEDLAIARSLPGFAVLAPADARAAYRLTCAAAEWDGPVYIRLGLDATPLVYSETTQFTVGGSNVVREGDDVTIVAAGLNTVTSALDAAQTLAGHGISACVVDLYSVKPLAVDVLVESAYRTGLVVTVEEHTTYGGVGAAVAEALATHMPTPMRALGLADAFSHDVCPYPEQLARQGLDSDGISRAVVESLRRWKP